MIGDGEADQGQIWEASMAAAKYKADNSDSLLDHNQFQQTGPVSEVMPALFPIVKNGGHLAGMSKKSMDMIWKK